MQTDGRGSSVEHNGLWLMGADKVLTAWEAGSWMDSYALDEEAVRLVLCGDSRHAVDRRCVTRQLVIPPKQSLDGAPAVTMIQKVSA